MLKPSELKLSQKQKEAIANANAQINIWHGAVRSGKTYSSLIRFLIEISEAQDGDMAIICRDAFTFRRNILPQLEQLIGSDLRYREGIGLLEIWNRKIHVVGAHDARAEGKIRGATFRGAYVDEVTLIPEAAFMILVQRCAMGGAKIFATTNPDSPFHWLKKDFLDGNSDVAAFPFTMLDNPKLTSEERAYLSRQHKGLWHRRFILGEWCLAEGAVFDFFDEKIHTLKKAPANAEHYLVGVDYGTTNACAFTLVGCNQHATPMLWVEKEYYFDSKKAGYQKSDSDYAQDLVNFMEPYAPRMIYLDPSAASFKVELRRFGIKTPIRDADNDVTNGIRSLYGHLSNGDLKIVSTCRNLIGEIQSYTWDTKASERGEDVPIKRADHAIDALRYVIHSHFGRRIELKDSRPTQKPNEWPALGHGWARF